MILNSLRLSCLISFIAEYFYCVYVATEELVELLRLADVTSLVKTLQTHDESQVSRLAKQAYTSIK